MIRISRQGRRIATMIVVAMMALRLQPATAQVPRTLDLGGPPRDVAGQGCATDAIVATALAAFNTAAAIHSFAGGATMVVGPGQTIGGNVAVYRSDLRVDGIVRGNVVVLNGDVRIFGTGVVTGTITVLGGRLVIDRGAQVTGTPFVCEQRVGLTKTADNVVVRSKPGPTFGTFRSSLYWDLENFHFTPHLGAGQYNRVEGLPGQIGFNVTRPFGSAFNMSGRAFAIVRTAHDPTESRPAVGWQAAAMIAHEIGLPFSVGISGGWTIRSTRDRPFGPIESGLSTVVLRRDYNDWYLNQGVTVSAMVRPATEVTVAASYEMSRQTSVLAVDAFSLLRSAEAWRPNPLIDDGKYGTLTAQVTWDARNEQDHPVLSWYARVGVKRISSDELTPVSIPTTIRDALPTSGYGATTADVDVRAYWRLGPEQRASFRLVGGGYVAGNALTIQERVAAGGASPLLGYDFRGVNCDRRRKVDPATPALCDRTLALQAEYRRTIPIDIGTRIGSYNVGIRNPALVFLGEIGSAWLAGDSAGRVPANRIQALREWHSDIGIGITTGRLGLYLSKALADPLPARLTLLFTPRL